MNALTRLSKFSLNVAKRTTISRVMISNTPRAAGGAKHDAHGHGDHGHGDHDDHAHHDHPMWENLPFGKGSSAFLAFGSSFLGVVLIVQACNHQQKKHGFSK